MADNTNDSFQKNAEQSSKKSPERNTENSPEQSTKKSTEKPPKKNRKQHILESLAYMLEKHPGERISIAALAKNVGVSEAALYRHFPSKTQMLEGLISFAEETIFERVKLISQDNLKVMEKLERIFQVYLVFCERNPGITRLLTGDAISGERERLHGRVRQFFDRLATECRQLLSKAELSEGLSLELSVVETIKLVQATAEGKVSAYVRTQFVDKPTEGWHEQWQVLSEALIREAQR